MQITLNFQPEPHKKKLHKCVTPNEMHIKINYTPCSLFIFFSLSFSVKCFVRRFFATNENPSEFSGNSIWLCVRVCVCVNVRMRANWTWFYHWKQTYVNSKNFIWQRTNFIWKMKHKTCADKLNKLRWPFLVHIVKNRVCCCCCSRYWNTHTEKSKRNKALNKLNDGTAFES